jgi:hypothetical protein
VPGLKAVLQEVSFPDELEWLAPRSRAPHAVHPRARDAEAPPRDIPWLLYHIKPGSQATVERELAALHRSELELLALGDRFAL